MFKNLLKSLAASLCCLICCAPTGLAQTQPHPASSSATPAANRAKPCAARPEYRQFDFWIGEWDVQVNGNRAGTNSVQLILGECVIFENWAGRGGMNGKSFNVYNAAKGQWQQTWVDSQGNVLELHGEFKNGAMRLAGENQNRQGAKVLHRLTFSPLAGGRVRQLWESSTDEGKTWSVAFDGLYILKKAAEAK